MSAACFITVTHDFAQPSPDSRARNGLGRVFEAGWPSIDVIPRSERWMPATRNWPYTMIARWRLATCEEIAEMRGE